MSSSIHGVDGFGGVFDDSILRCLTPPPPPPPAPQQQQQLQPACDALGASFLEATHWPELSPEFVDMDLGLDALPPAPPAPQALKSGAGDVLDATFALGGDAIVDDLGDPGDGCPLDALTPPAAAAAGSAVGCSTTPKPLLFDNAPTTLGEAPGHPLEHTGGSDLEESLAATTTASTTVAPEATAAAWSWPAPAAPASPTLSSADVLPSQASSTVPSPLSSPSIRRDPRAARATPSRRPTADTSCRRTRPRPSTAAATTATTKREAELCRMASIEVARLFAHGAKPSAPKLLATLAKDMSAPPPASNAPSAKGHFYFRREVLGVDKPLLKKIFKVLKDSDREDLGKLFRKERRKAQNQVSQAKGRVKTRTRMDELTCTNQELKAELGSVTRAIEALTGLLA